ncbi:PadR family transcriptional regulator [Pseudonocardia hispaniensis]|uniref:PadR family transcriptional regulator n=1 Tax=Pseudonocardia hispaniensis TaxID=904933 RepID=A0ABW1J8B6_9PSEU
MAKRTVSNPLALAVLGLLSERPMHPYEMASTLRGRAKEESIKLNYGSLYSVVESLHKHGLIEAVETVKEGRRPERTIYGITEPGRTEFADWLSELIAVPAKEYTRFEAALSLLGGLPPDEVLGLLQLRAHRLAMAVAAGESALARSAAQGLPRLFSIEFEYRLTQARAELAFVELLIDDVADGRIEGYEMWRRMHESGEFPTDAEIHNR